MPLVFLISIFPFTLFISSLPQEFITVILAFTESMVEFVKSTSSTSIEPFTRSMARLSYIFFPKDRWITGVAS